MAPRKNLFLAISSKDHFYCVFNKDLLVADVTTVHFDDKVSFKYGNKEYAGIVKSNPGTESEVMQVIEGLKKEKRLKRPSSFDASKPRKAAVKQREMLQEQLGKKPAASEKSKSAKQMKHKAQRDSKKAKEKAGLLMEEEIDPTADGKGEDNSVQLKMPDESSDESSDSSSESDTLPLSAAAAKRNGTNKDAHLIRNMYSESEGDERNITSPSRKRKSAMVNIDESKKSKVEDSQGSMVSHLQLSNEMKEDVSIPSDSIDHDPGEEEIKSDDLNMEVEKEEKVEGKSEGAFQNREGKPTVNILSGTIEMSSSLNLTHIKNKKKKEKEDKKVKKGKKVKKDKKHVKSRRVSSYDSSEGEDVPTSLDQKIRKDKIVLEEPPAGKEKEKKDAGKDSAVKKKEENNQGMDSNDNKKEEKSQEMDSDDDKKKEKKEEKHSDEMKRKKLKKKAKVMKKTKKAKKKAHKAKKKVKRNVEVFQGVNFLHSKEAAGCVKLHNDYEVYVKESEYKELLKVSTASRFVRGLVDKVYTKEAILGSTPQGYPPRGKGKDYYKNKNNMQPRLHPDGLGAIIAAAKDQEAENKAWRPRAHEKNLRSAFAVRCCELKQQWSLVSSSESSEESSESSSSSDSSSDSDSRTSSE